MIKSPTAPKRPRTSTRALPELTMPDESEEELSDRQLALLEGLRDVERADEAVDIDALALRTGYSPSSIRTYFTKKLEGVMVFREEGEWRVRGAIRCKPETFARRMSQKAGASSDALRSQDSWRAVLRKLLYEGQRRHYRLGRQERARSSPSCSATRQRRARRRCSPSRRRCSARSDPERRGGRHRTTPRDPERAMRWCSLCRYDHREPMGSAHDHRAPSGAVERR